MVRNMVEQAGTTMVEASQDCPAFRSAEVVGMVSFVLFLSGGGRGENKIT